MFTINFEQTSRVTLTFLFYLSEKKKSTLNFVGKKFRHWQHNRHFLRANFFAWLSKNNWIKKTFISYLDH